jgi:hypothetical protein
MAVANHGVIFDRDRQKLPSPANRERLELVFDASTGGADAAVALIFGVMPAQHPSDFSPKKN